MATFAHAMDRAGQLAQHGKVYDSQIPRNNNYNYNSRSYANNNNKANGAPTKASRGYNYNSGGSQNFVAMLKRDPLVKKAMSSPEEGGWGMWLPSLIRACYSCLNCALQRYEHREDHPCRKYTPVGFDKVKHAILVTENIQDRYFDEDKPILPQRGAYAMRIMQNYCV